MKPPLSGPARQLTNRVARRNSVLAVTFYALGVLLVLAALGILVELIFGLGLFAGFILIDVLIADLALTGAAFAIGHQFARRAKALTQCKRCGGRLRLISAVDSNPRDPSEGHTEYTYVCSDCGMHTTMVEG